MLRGLLPALQKTPANEPFVVVTNSPFWRIMESNDCCASTIKAKNRLIKHVSGLNETISF